MGSRFRSITVFFRSRPQFHTKRAASAWALSISRWVRLGSSSVKYALFILQRLGAVSQITTFETTCRTVKQELVPTPRPSLMKSFLGEGAETTPRRQEIIKGQRFWLPHALRPVARRLVVSHCLFLFVASRAEFQSDDNQRDCEHEDHVGELRNRDRRGGAAADQRVPARGRAAPERPVYELRAGEARVHSRRHRETVGPRGHTREVPVERATVRLVRCGARSDVVEPVWKRDHAYYCL